MVVKTLNAVSGLAASNNAPLIKIATAIAVLIMSIKIIFNQNVRNIAGFEVLKMGTFVIAIQALFINAPDDDNHAYAVIDRISLQTTEVRQVPKAIGEFLSLFTTLEDGIMKKMELYFTTPDSLSYRQAGLGFTVGSQMEIMKSNIINANLKKTFEDYFLNCKVDGDFSADTQKLQHLISAEGTNLLTKLGTDRTNLTVYYTDATPDGSVISCKDAWTQIKTALGTEALNNQAAYAKARGMMSSTYASKVAMSDMITGSTSSATSAKNQLESAIARNATIDSIQKVANFNGVSDTLLTKQLSISELSMTNSSILSNYQAQQTVPILKALCTAFVIVLSWLAGILAIATMNPGYIKTIIILNVWLMLWSPLFQVLNFAIDILVEDALSLYSSGLNASNQVGVYEILGGKLAIVTNLVWSVPILAYGIAKGGEFAMTQFISAMISPVQSAAHHTAKDDLSSALSNNASYLTSDGVLGVKNETTGSGSAQRGLNADKNFKNYNSGTGTYETTHRMDKNITATADNNGGISVTNSRQSASNIHSAQQSLADSQQHTKSLQSQMAQDSANTAAITKTNGDSTVTNLATGKTSAVNESDVETYNKINSAASSKAFGTTHKDALTDSIAKNLDSTTAAALGISVNSDKALIGAAVEKFIGAGATANLNSRGGVTLTSANGTSFELSKSSSFGKEFSQNYQSSIAEQLQTSKGNTQAYANVVSAVNGESQSDSNSTSNKVSKAFTELDSASQTYQAVKSQGTSSSNDLMNSAWQNYFSNDRFKNYTPEQKADYAVNKMYEWNQSAEGIKDSINFIKDNTNPPELKNPINNTNKIEHGEKDLGEKTSNVETTTYNPNSNSGTKSNIEAEGNKIENTQVGESGFKEEVTSNTDKSKNVTKETNEKWNDNGKVIDAHQQKNANEKNNNLGMNAAEVLDKGNTDINNVVHAITGKKENVNPEAQRFAEHNEVQNKTTYTNATQGDDKLIKSGYFSGSDNINNTQLGKTNTEDLSRIYHHDKVNNTLNESSKASLHNELEKRGYDFNSNQHSSKYEPTEIKSSVIPNGDKYNPGSDIQNTEQLNKGKSDFNYDWKNTME